MVKSELCNSGPTIRNYRIEAAFIPYFNKHLLTPIVRSVAQEAIDEMIIEEFAVRTIN